MREIVVMSGKGGTGKTSITAALGVLAGSRAVVVDCDVDAANLHLLYEPERQERREFWSGRRAAVDPDSCVGCGICQEKCLFGAIDLAGGQCEIDPLSCEGCGVCSYFCPDGVISMQEVLAGEWFVSRSRFDHWFVHARLGIGEGNSGKLVSRIRQEARRIAKQNGLPRILADGPPGIGCPVIASLSGVDHVLIVTEATRSGLHDLRRLVDLVDHFEIGASCVINKFDLNEEATREIERFCGEKGIRVAGSIPYSRLFFDSLQAGKTVMEMDDPEIEKKITAIWEHLTATEQVS